MAPHDAHDAMNMDMDMPGMDMGGSSSSSSSSGSMAGMSMMMSVFQTNMNTALYSTSWTPTTTGAYAGTCIFLAILAIFFRLLLWGKSLAEARWLDSEMKRRYVVVQGKAGMGERVASDGESRKGMLLSENGVEEDVVVLERKKHEKRPWRLSVDPLRALFDTVIVGVGYLLMLAVMTMNVGYFASILAGTFVGSLLVGRYTGLDQH